MDQIAPVEVPVIGRQDTVQLEPATPVQPPVANPVVCERENRLGTHFPHGVLQEFLEPAANNHRRCVPSQQQLPGPVLPSPLHADERHQRVIVVQPVSPRSGSVALNMVGIEERLTLRAINLPNLTRPSVDLLRRSYSYTHPAGRANHSPRY